MHVDDLDNFELYLMRGSTDYHALSDHHRNHETKLRWYDF